MNIFKSRKGRESKLKGNIGENITALALFEIGLSMIEKVETPMGIKRDKSGKIVSVFYKDKVSGDFRAIFPRQIDKYGFKAGQSVLVECKLRPFKLSFSDLETHQHTALANHAKYGGVSIVSFVCGRFCYLIDYTKMNITKGNPKRPDEITGIIYSRKF